MIAEGRTTTGELSSKLQDLQDLLQKEAPVTPDMVIVQAIQAMLPQAYARLRKGKRNLAALTARRGISFFFCTQSRRDELGDQVRLLRSRLTACESALHH